jgi:hypothetical protein
MRAGRGAARRGFSAIETVVVCFLTVVLTYTLGSAWRGLCLPALDASARCRLAMEANLAAASLARDLGGYLSDPSGRLGGLNDAKYVGRDTTSPDRLRLCFHGGTGSDMTPQWAAPDAVISYQLQGSSLVRWNEAGGEPYTVARSVSAFQVAPLEDGTGVAISLTFANAARGLSLTYTLVALDPTGS